MRRELGSKMGGYCSLGIFSILTEINLTLNLVQDDLKTVLGVLIEIFRVLVTYRVILVALFDHHVKILHILLIELQLCFCHVWTKNRVFIPNIDHPFIIFGAVALDEIFSSAKFQWLLLKCDKVVRFWTLSEVEAVLYLAERHVAVDLAARGEING